jgi:hypothetical protein
MAIDSAVAVQRNLVSTGRGGFVAESLRAMGTPLGDPHESTLALSKMIWAWSDEITPQHGVAARGGEESQAKAGPPRADGRQHSSGRPR